MAKDKITPRLISAPNPVRKLGWGLFVVLNALTLTNIQGCSNGSDANEASKTEVPASLITSTTVVSKPLEDTLSSVGQISTTASPKISAEVAGNIIRINKDIGKNVNQGEVIAEIDPEVYRLNQQAAKANVKRLNALLENQKKVLQRSEQLLEKGFISDSRFEDLQAQLTATKEQLAQAQAQYATTTEQLSKTKIISPVDGQIINRLISVGDYAVPGKPLFEISTAKTLQVVLMFPETLAPKFVTGQTVRLASPASPDKIAVGQVTEVLSAIDASSRSVRLVVEVENPGNWKPGASVSGEVVLSTKEDALLVPSQSVVLRPAGKVVYVVENDIVKERIVETGQRINGKIEIVDGLQAGETVAFDGAGFLADNARIKVKGVN